MLGEGTGIFSDLSDYLNSLRKILNVNPDRILPGHGPVIEVGKAFLKHTLSYSVFWNTYVYNSIRFL